MLYIGIAAFFDKVLTFTLGARFDQRPISTYTISHYKLSFWAAASAQRALAAAVRARPSPLHIKKALASKWYYTISCERTKQSIRRKRRGKRGAIGSLAVGRAKARGRGGVCR
jgi:hypothetical protein